MYFRKRPAKSTSPETNQDNGASKQGSSTGCWTRLAPQGTGRAPQAGKMTLGHPSRSSSRVGVEDSSETPDTLISLPTVARIGRSARASAATIHTRPSSLRTQSCLPWHTRKMSEAGRAPGFCRPPPGKTYSCPVVPRGGARRTKECDPTCQKACHASRKGATWGLLLPFGCARVKERHCPPAPVTVRFWASSPAVTSPSHQCSQNTGNAHLSPAWGKMNII